MRSVRATHSISKYIIYRKGETIMTDQEMRERMKKIDLERERLKKRAREIRSIF